MTKKDWFIVIGLVLVIWAIDLITKSAAEKWIHDLQYYGPIGFVFHRNPGAMLGMFAELPKILRIVTLSTGGAFLIFIYGAIQYLLPKRSFILRTGMSILLGGILGNVTDRILAGSVRDFILLGSPSFSTPAFNFADAIQWVGYSMVVYSLIKDGNQFWPKIESRKRIWVYPKFQLRYILILVAIGFGFSIISGVFSYTYIWVTIQDLVGGRSMVLEKKFLTPFLITYSLICLGFTVILFLLGRILSHRTAGPIYAFEKFLEGIINGEDRKLKLRAGDEFRHLEAIAESIGLTLQDHIEGVGENMHTESNSNNSDGPNPSEVSSESNSIQSSDPVTKPSSQ